MLDGRMDGVIAIWAPCMMHRVANCVFGVLAVFALMVPLFCASVLLHQASVFDLLCKKMDDRIASVTMVFRKPAEFDENRNYLSALFAFAEHGLESDLEEGQTPLRQQRRLACDRLAFSLAASTIVKGLRNYQ
jgi:hypothetical protein